MNQPIRFLHRFTLRPNSIPRAAPIVWPFDHINTNDFALKQFNPYSVQLDAWILIKNGKSMILNWGTGSGKTEAVIFPILDRLKKSAAHCLVLYPMKGLAQDQRIRLQRLCF